MATEPTNTPPRDLLTLDELIQLTGWKKTKLYEDAQAGRLPFPVLRNGRRYFFSRVTYQRWLEGDTSNQSDDAA